MAAHRASAAGGGTSGTGDRTCTITPAVGDLFLVFVAVKANTNNTPTCSDNNGGSYDLITGASLPFESSLSRFAAFVRTSLLANTTSTVVTPATGSNASGEVVVEAISGMTRTGLSAIRSSGTQSNQTAGGTPAPALNQAALTGNVTVGSVGNASNPANLTTPTNWTERQDVGQTNTPVGVHVVTRNSGFTGTTVTWGSTSAGDFASIILELDGSHLPLTADVLSLTLAGVAVGFLFSLPADVLALSLAGQDVNLLHNRTLSADPLALTLAGQDAGLVLAGLLTADPLALTLAGQDVGLLFGYSLTADPLALTLGAPDAGLVASDLTLVAEPLALTLTALDVDLPLTRAVVADTLALSLTCHDVDIVGPGSAGDVSWWGGLWLGLRLGV